MLGMHKVAVTLTREQAEFALRHRGCINASPVVIDGKRYEPLTLLFRGFFIDEHDGDLLAGCYVFRSVQPKDVDNDCEDLGCLPGMQSDAFECSLNRQE